MQSPAWRIKFLWVDMFFTLKKLLCVCVLSHVQFLATPCTVVRQALYMEFSRQVRWSGLPFPIPGDPPNPGMEPEPASPALTSGFFTTAPPRKPEEATKIN